MKTITIYELLGMIKDGNAPKKIKVTGTIYEYDEEYEFYFTKTKEENVALGGKRNEINLIYNFNVDNVEIIEEKKIPEKLEKYYYYLDDGSNSDNYFENILKLSENGESEITEAESLMIDKINGIIDYLESKEKGE